jgi:hypothetical protein
MDALLSRARKIRMNQISVEIRQANDCDSVIETPDHIIHTFRIPAETIVPDRPAHVGAPDRWSFPTTAEWRRLKIQLIYNSW